jgi:hypothetical protein
VTREQAFAVVPVLLATWYVNASVFDWYHVRRFTGIVPLLAPGLAVLIAPVARVAVLAAVLALAFLRYDVAVDALRAIPGDPAPLGRVVHEVGDGLAADTYAVLEPVAPRTAIKMMAGYTGQPVVGGDPVRIDLGGEPAILRLPVRARSLSAPSFLDGVACRWVRGDEARLFIPVAGAAPLAVTITAAPADTGDPPMIEVSWMERSVGIQPMAAGWSTYRFDVPDAQVRTGTNVITIAFRRAGVARREVRRSAALGSVTVQVRQK